MDKQASSPNSPTAIAIRVREMAERHQSPAARNADGTLTEYGVAIDQQFGDALDELLATPGHTLTDALALLWGGNGALEAFFGTVANGSPDWKSAERTRQALEGLWKCLEHLSGGRTVFSTPKVRLQ